MAVGHISKFQTYVLDTPVPMRYLVLRVCAMGVLI